MNKPHIIDANTSGQGFHPSAEHHPYRATVEQFGYVYGHSTPVGWMDGNEQLWDVYHTFTRGEHRVSLKTNLGTMWSPYWGTTVSCASGNRHTGNGSANLEKHLKYKARRYKLT